MEFDSPPPTQDAWRGCAGLGQVGNGGARLGEEIEMGDRQASRFEPSTPTQRGKARRGEVWRCVEWQGRAMPGKGRGDGLRGGSTPPAPRTRHGGARCGPARRGLERLGKAGRGGGMARLGGAGQGPARLGKGNTEVLGASRGPIPRHLTHGEAMQGGVRRGPARRGKGTFSNYVRDTPSEQPLRTQGRSRPVAHRL